MYLLDRGSLCCPGWSAVMWLCSRLTASSTSGLGSHFRAWVSYRFIDAFSPRILPSSNSSVFEDNWTFTRWPLSLEWVKKWLENPSPPSPLTLRFISWSLQSLRQGLALKFYTSVSNSLKNRLRSSSLLSLAHLSRPLGAGPRPHFSQSPFLWAITYLFPQAPQSLSIMIKHNRKCLIKGS